MWFWQAVQPKICVSDMFLVRDYERSGADGGVNSKKKSSCCFQPSSGVSKRGGRYSEQHHTHKQTTKQTNTHTHTHGHTLCRVVRCTLQLTQKHAINADISLQCWPQAALMCPCRPLVQVHKTDQVLPPTCIHSFVECGRMQVPHSPAFSPHAES